MAFPKQLRKIDERLARIERHLGIEEEDGERVLVQETDMRLDQGTLKAPASPPADDETDDDAPPTDDLESLTVSELRELAREQEIAGYSSMKKDELIDALVKSG